MKTSPNVVSEFLKRNGVFQKNSHNYSALGEKALASANYFNVNLKNLRKIDKQKIVYQANAFNKMIKIIQPDLTPTERMISRFSHCKLFETISFALNMVIFNNKALLIGFAGGTIMSLGYLLYSQLISNSALNWLAIPLFYTLCYIIGQLVALISYITTRNKDI